MKFIDRVSELQFLERKYKESGAQLIIIYGKRRVGKTELVKQFFKDKPHIYFLADRTSSFYQLKEISEKVGAFYEDTFLQERGFGNWIQVFEYLKRRKGKLIIVVDEFPYLIETDRAIPSLFQKGWDEHLKDSEIFFIILGSSISMMETEVLSYKAPLYGRRTGQLLIEPLRFRDCCQFFPKRSFDEWIALYAILGGTPAYLLKFDPSKGVWRNVKEKILSKGEFLYEEPEFILREELREPRNYFSILRAIALGKSKIGEIMNEAGLGKNVITKYLSVLSDLKIVQREVPATEMKPEKSKRGIYKIIDPFFKFWFGFVFPNRGYLEEGAQDYVLGQIRGRFSGYLSETYETAARELLWEFSKADKLPMNFTHIGRWWEKNEEIDIVAINREGNEILFGEVKWTSMPVGLNIFEDLKRKSKLVRFQRTRGKEVFVLFSKSGFTEGLLRKTKEENMFLIERDKIVSRKATEPIF